MKMKGTVESITKDWPKPNHVKVTQTGFNFYHKKMCFCFHYNEKATRSNKVVFNNKSIDFLSTQETEALFKLCPQISPEKLVLAVAKERKATKSDNGATNCINHINKKIELIEADTERNNNRVLIILKQLTQELKQYI